MPPENGSTTGQGTSGTDTGTADAQSQDQAQTAGAGTTDVGLPGTPAALQAFATQRSQLAAAALAELGLGKSASAEDIQTAIRDLRTSRAVDDESDDPVLSARAKELDRRAWNLAQQEVGPEISQAARTFYDEMRTSRDPSTFVRAFNAAVMEAAGILNGAQSQDQAQPAGQTQTAVPDLVTPGQAPASDQPPRAADFRGRTGEFLAARASWLRGRATG